MAADTLIHNCMRRYDKKEDISRRAYVDKELKIAISQISVRRLEDFKEKNMK